jgi:predicted hydrocarbon binding protein
MVNVQIKAQGLLNAAKWIEEEYGRERLGEVVRACSAPVRDRYVSAIAINWHPVEEFVEFVEVADRVLGRGKMKLPEEIGAAGARANMKGTLVRIAFYLKQPEFLFRRVAGLWHQFNDEGQMLVHELGDSKGVMEVTGIVKPNATFCAVLTGWMRAVASGIGIENPTVRHTQCRARGDAKCIWEARWVSMEKDEKKAVDASPRRVAITKSTPPSSGGAPSAPSSGKVLPVSGKISLSSAKMPAGAARTSSSQKMQAVPEEPAPARKSPGRPGGTEE